MMKFATVNQTQLDGKMTWLIMYVFVTTATVSDFFFTVEQSCL